MMRTAAPPLLRHVRRLAAAASSDEQLLAEFLARRSDEAFAALLARHGPMVWNVCRRVLHDAHAAEDVFQATFLVLADRAAAIRRPTALAGFLHGVAYRLAVRARRRRLQSVPAAGCTDAVCDRAALPADGLAWKEMLGILDDELARLSDRYRAPLVLCYLEGRTQDEVARHLGWGLNTLRRRLAQGRRLLEARLRGRGVTLPAALAGVLAAGAAGVPGHLQAATLTAAAAALTPTGHGITLLLSASGKKIVALVAVVLGAACLAYCSTSPADQAPAANEAPPRVAAAAGGVVQDNPNADALPPGGAIRIGTARYRHGIRIERLAVSADGRLAVTAGGFGEYIDPPDASSPARVFDLTDGRCLYSFPEERWSYTEAVALSPDGKTLATKDDTFLDLRDAATGKEIRRLKYVPAAGGAASNTRWLTFTPDGKRVAAPLTGNAIQLIDVETGQVTRTFECGASGCACAFSADGTLMAAGGYAPEKDVCFARLYEVATGKELRRFAVGHGPGGSISALAFSPDGTTLAGSAWPDGRLRLFEAATAQERKAFARIGDSIGSIAFAPDGKTVAAAGDHIHLYDPDTGTERLRIERPARGLAFIPRAPLAPPGKGAGGEDFVLIGAVSGAIYRWDAASGRQLTPAAGPDTAVEQILVGPDRRTMFTTDQDGQLFAWDLAGNKPPRRIVDGLERGFVASPDGRLLAWVTARGAHGGSRVRLYDVAAERLIDHFPVCAFASVVSFLPDGKTLVTLGGQAPPPTVRLWDVASGQERRSIAVALPDPYGDLHGGAPAADGVPVRLWDLATGKAGHQLHDPGPGAHVPGEAGTGGDLGGVVPRWTNYSVRQAALSPDGKTLALGFDLGRRRMKSMDGRAFSPDGRLLVDWAENPFGRSRIDHVSVWDAATGRLVATLAAGPRAGARNAAFAPDGRTFATASADGTVRLWEVATWTVRAEFRGHRDRVTAVAFGPDGRLFTGGLDTVVFGWEVRPSRDAVKGALAEVWTALAAPDAKTGYQAQGRFLAGPAGAVEWFAARLRPAAAVDPARVKAQLADLGSDDFATRTRATVDLKEHWPVTEAALRAFAAKAPTLEARRRAEGIIREMEQAATPPEALRGLRAAEVLEWIATPPARTLLGELAKGAADAPLTRASAAACKRLAEGR
jgi:RNA polymerase sigma factor (sigma-70 family)